jgi:hypothetical protein
MQQKKYSAKEIARDSLWVTIAWEWLQKLLGRAVDSVLWVTMVFAGYQLIPGAPQPWISVSITMFIAQFIALDIGGLGLNQLARQQGLPRWAYARVVAYALIGITLVTIAYAGLEHAIPSLNPQVAAEMAAKAHPRDAHPDLGLGVLITTWVEVVLVVARSVMTVLYGQAIHSLKAEEHERQDRVAGLEQEVSNLRERLENGQAEVSNLRTQLDSEKQKVSNLTVQSQSEVSNLTVQSQKEVSNLRIQLSNAKTEVDTLRAQLDTKEQQLTRLKETLDSGMKWHESTTQEVVSNVQSQLDSERARVSSLQKELSNEKQKVSNLTVQLQEEVSNLTVQSQKEVSNLRTQLSNLTVQSQKEVSNLRVQLEIGQKEVQSLTTQLDSEKQKVSKLQEKLNRTQRKEDEEEKRVIHLDTNRMRRSRQDAEEKAMVEAIRNLLKAEPELSGRAIAAKVGCSPTTATKWKELIEKEASEECVND